MASPYKPFVRGPKIGRNDPCFCGSGRKFKHCHGSVQVPSSDRGDGFQSIVDEGSRLVEQHKMRERQRQEQQGYGKPIISAEFKGYRFVAVGNQLHYGKWKTFADFLSDYIKRVLDSEWGNTEIKKPFDERHPVMQWYERMCRLQAEHFSKPNTVYSTPMTGAISAYTRLAYNLYLIAHNGKDIQTKLIARLKNKDNFQGAFFETQVAAWLIKAGFELEFENEADRTSTHCEFTATYGATGEKYSVEAKSREIEIGDASRPKVGRKLYEALEKRADHHRLIFLNLNKPLHTPEALRLALDRAERIVKQSEGLQIADQPAPPAYVCITNMNDQYALDATSLALAAMFVGYKIPDFMGARFSSLREAARARERHWPMFQLFRSIEEHSQIPMTFGGEYPSEVFAANPQPKLQIGNRYAVPGPSGAEVNAILVDAAVLGDKAHCVLKDPATGESWIGGFEMTPDELADHARHPQTYFGANKGYRQQAESPIDLFDFFVHAHRGTPRERLVEMLSRHPEQSTFSEKSDKDLVELLAEGYVNSAIMQGAFVEPPKDMRRSGKAGARPPDGLSVA